MAPLRIAGQVALALFIAFIVYFAIGLVVGVAGYDMGWWNDAATTNRIIPLDLIVAAGALSLASWAVISLREV